MAAVIFVEGKADVKFISDYISHIGLPSSEIVIFGGNTNWQKMESTIKLKYNSADKLLFIFDADTNPTASKTRIIQELTSIGINNRYDVFLFPNNADNGNLENLIINIPEPQYSSHFNCFDEYLTCVSAKGLATNLPGNKAKVYTYIEIMNYDPRDEKRDYIGCGLFDLNSAYLAPLQQFLNANL